MTARLVTSYDELPYDDHVFAYAQPANLATVAALHGLEPPSLDRCRVLDIGCAAGANLMPMASTRPGAEFVGIDLSPRQIETGRQTISRLGLNNVALHVRNLLEPTDDLGAFDYVICHGVYSWVPPPVQERILNLIRRQLAPNGLAYISYNTYPGWHLRGLVRDVLAFHAAGVDGGPAVQTAQARAFFDFVVDALPEQNSAYEAILRREAEHLRALSDSYVYHEYLEANNRPLYFHQFAAHAAKHGLQYLAEAAPQPMPGKLKPGTLETMASLASDHLRMEQYLDFIRCRIFRRNVLCHAAVRPDRAGLVDRVSGFATTSRARPGTDCRNPDPAGREEFFVSDELRFATSDPPLREAMWRLWEARPVAVPFADLLAAARCRTPDRCDLPRELADGLLQLYLGAVVNLHLHPPTVVAAAGPRPCTSPFVRFQAERGDPRISNLCHQAVEVDAFTRYLLPLLDGTRTLAELVDVLATRAAAGVFAFHDNDDRAVSDPAQIRIALSGWVETALNRLSREALLMA
jgi:SAM-dependent methyltransferase